MNLPRRLFDFVDGGNDIRLVTKVGILNETDDIALTLNGLVLQ